MPNYISTSAVSNFSIMTGVCMICDYQEKEEKLDGDAALNKFFRDIYKDADEDMRRAMMKSFVRDLHTSAPLLNTGLELAIIEAVSLVLTHTLSGTVPVQVESNGTVLSTNWKDVGSKKVEGSPPDGMELKKWEY